MRNRKDTGLNKNNIQNRDFPFWIVIFLLMWAVSLTANYFRIQNLTVENKGDPLYYFASYIFLIIIMASIVFAFVKKNRQIFLGIFVFMVSCAALTLAAAIPKNGFVIGVRPKEITWMVYLGLLKPIFVNIESIFKITKSSNDFSIIFEMICFLMQIAAGGLILCTLLKNDRMKAASDKGHEKYWFLKRLIAIIVLALFVNFTFCGLYITSSMSEIFKGFPYKTGDSKIGSMTWGGNIKYKDFQRIKNNDSLDDVIDEMGMQPKEIHDDDQHSEGAKAYFFKPNNEYKQEIEVVIDKSGKIVYKEYYDVEMICSNNELDKVGTYKFSKKMTKDETLKMLKKMKFYMVTDERIQNGSEIRWKDTYRYVNKDLSKGFYVEFLDNKLSNWGNT